MKGSVDTTRAFAYIDDIIDGLMLTKNMENIEIYHIGNDEQTIGYLANQILNHLQIMHVVESMTKSET